MGTATLLRDDMGVGNSHKRYYRCNPAFPGPDGLEFDCVAVSAAMVMGEPETYIFGCDDRGKIILWSELDGSFKGGLDHELALSNAGYIVDKFRKVEFGRETGPAPDPSWTNCSMEDE